MATEQDLQDFTTQVTCPDDFDDYWAVTLEMLSAISLKPVVSAEPLRSNDDVHVFNVTYLSLGGLVPCRHRFGNTPVLAMETPRDMGSRAPGIGSMLIS